MRINKKKLARTVLIIALIIVILNWRTCLTVYGKFIDGIVEGVKASSTTYQWEKAIDEGQTWNEYMAEVKQ